MAITTECPSCEENISLHGKLELGKKIRCPHCDADLEVVGLSPVELDWADYDDWDDEWDDDDEDDDDDDDW
ncbi:MAG: hypothetical protein JXA33_01415 [Anaerolineae bacterium]|nr:hypothetical protein [Anaerolineae bacterium]